MRSESSAQAGWDVGATAAGAVAGLVALVLLGTVLALILYRYPLASTTADWAVQGVRVLAYLIAGLWAGRRAGDNGLLHGASAGLVQLALTVAIALIAREGWPAGTALLKQFLIALGSGALGGVIGVNLAF